MYKTITLNNEQHILLCEALHRIAIGPEDRNATSLFLGLGFPSQYRSAVKAGLMEPSFNPETPRVLNWYCLSSTGRKIVNQMIRKYGKKNALKNMPYTVKVKA